MIHEPSEHPAAYSRMLAYDSRFDYLDARDRYYLSKPEVEANLAIIGLGVNGRGHVASVLTEGRGAIRGLYDPHESSVRAALKLHEQFAPTDNVRTYASLAETIQDDGVDAFIIATPNYKHLDVLKEVLTAGKPVFLEKPMASTLDDAAAIRRLVYEAGVPVQVGLQYRYKAMYVESIAELLERRSLGDLRTLSITEHRIPFLDKVGQWNKFSRYSGGTLVEKCCHYFDLFNLLSNSRARRVFASGSQAVNYSEFEYEGHRSDILDNASVIVEYENGVRATFDLCMFAPLFYEELVACGNGGRLRAFEQEDFTSNDSFKTGLEVYTGELHPVRFCEPRYAGVIRQLGHSGADFFAQGKFMDLILDRTTITPGAEEGFWSVVVGAAAEASVERGAPVDIGQFLAEHGIES